MTFIRSINPLENVSGEAFFLIFNAKGYLLEEKNKDDDFSVPCSSMELKDRLKLTDLCFIGYYNGRPCYCAGFDGDDVISLYSWTNLRSILGRVSSDIWDMIGYAKQIHDCQVNFRFCGRCGEKTGLKTDEQGRYCKTCNLVFYPRISPAIITAVIREDKILLARGVNFPNKKMFSVLAGFVDAQERLEDCVRREVLEETGIQVRNVRYFGSQPWPFPDSLMIGFTADYESGDIRIDPGEIAEAGWFGVDDLPLVPGKPTLSGELIQWFVRSRGTGPDVLP